MAMDLPVRPSLRASLTYYEYPSGRRAGPSIDFKCSLPSVGARPKLNLVHFPLTLPDPLLSLASKSHACQSSKATLLHAEYTGHGHWMLFGCTGHSDANQEINVQPPRIFPSTHGARHTKIQRSQIFLHTPHGKHSGSRLKTGGREHGEVRSTLLAF